MIDSEAREPSAFVSYSWDDEEHRAWVYDLATRLRTDGVDAKLDEWEASLGDPLPEFMERAVRENDFVLVICTPKYKERSDGRVGGVGYEGGIMTAEVLSEKNHRKFIPVLRKGGWSSAFPSWLSGKKGADLRGEGGARIGEMVEDVEDRDAVEGLVRERKRGSLASNAPGRGPVEHRLRVVEANPGAVRKVTCELSLAAAYIEHPGEALGDEAPGDQLVNVPCHRVAAKHRAREAHAAGEEEYMAEGSYTRLQKVINVPKLHAL